jgi:hypothetical protein
MSFLASLGGSIASGILGANAAQGSSTALQQGGQNAINAITAGAGQATGAQQAATAGQVAGAAPYTTLGSASANSLLNALNSGAATTPYQSFQAPTGVNEQNDPGYAFRLSQGLGALQNSAAAGGNLFSGNAAVGLENYAQNYASNEYQNVYNRALQGYQTNAANYYTGQQNLYNRLAGGTQIGQGSQSQLNQLSQAGAQNLGNIDLSAAGANAQQLNNIAGARAGGIMGANNAYQSMIGGLTGNLGTMGQGFLQSQQGAGSAFNQSGNGLLNLLGNAAGWI